MLLIMKLCAALLLGSLVLRCQTVSFGVRGGLPIDNFFSADGGTRARTQRYTVGPAMEVGLLRGFAAGADFLFEGATLGLSAGSSSAKVHRWELPLLLKYKTISVPAHPFVYAGISFNRVFRIAGARPCARGPFGEQFYCVDDSNLTELRHRGTHGPMAGCGVQFRLKAIRFVPELRLTRWVDRNFGVRDSPLRSNVMRAEILLGAMF